MSNDYPLKVLQIHEFEGAPYIMGLYSKGHHDTKEFLAAANEVFKTVTQRSYQGLVLKPKYVIRQYARNVPAGTDDFILQFTDKPGRGAYAVTSYDLDKAASDKAYSQAMWALRHSQRKEQQTT